MKKGGRVVLLGPDPANGSYSTFRYFCTCSEELGVLVKDAVIETTSPAGEVWEISPSESRVRVWARNYVAWPSRLRGIEGDVYHIVDQGLALYGRMLKAGSRLVTVHDLISYMTYLRELPFAPLSWRRKIWVLGCMRQIVTADHVFAISECTASALMKYSGLPSDRITVTPNCAHRVFRLCSSRETFAARARLFGDREVVILCVGSNAEYKNRISALRAFGVLRKRFRDAHFHIVGGLGTSVEMVLIKELEVEGSVHYWGSLPVEELVYFYNAADALIFPSIYEGFGLPPLEAMKCGCPVVATACGSLKEVVGEAALIVDDPLGYAQMAQYLEDVIRDGALRRDLRNLGLLQASKFSVRRSMEGIAEVYERFLV